MHLVNSADTCLCCANSAHIMHIYLPGTGVFHGIVFAPALYSVLSPQMMNSWVHRFLSKIAKFFSSYGFFLASTFIHSIPRSLFQFTYLFSSLQVQFLPRRPSLFPMQQNGQSTSQHEDNSVHHFRCTRFTVIFSPNQVPRQTVCLNTNGSPVVFFNGHELGSIPLRDESK